MTAIDERINDAVTRLLESDPDKAVWQTKDGRKIPVKEMADSHLLNTIAYLRRRFGDPAGSAMRRIAMELAMSDLMALCGPMGPRGDMAQMAAEAEFEQMEDIEHIPLFRALLTEKSRRGLS